MNPLKAALSAKTSAEQGIRGVGAALATKVKSGVKAYKSAVANDPASKKRQAFFDKYGYNQD